MPVDDDSDDGEDGNDRKHKPKYCECPHCTSNTDSDTSTNNNERTTIRLESHDLQVYIQSTEPLEEMSDVADRHIRQMQRAALVGEYEVLEESEALFDILGGR